MSNFARGWNSVHAKLLRTILWSSMAGMLIAGFILLVIANNSARNNMVEGLRVTGNIIAEGVAASMIFLDVQSATEKLSLAKNRQNIDYLCLYDIQGALFSSFYQNEQNSQARCVDTAEPFTQASLKQPNGHLVLVIPVVEQLEGLGHLQIFANTDVLNKNQLLLSAIVIVTLCASLLLAYLVGSRLVRRALMPLEALYHTSKIVAKDPFCSERASKISDDEVGRLVDVFNAMLDNLDNENKALVFSENRFRSLSDNAPIGVFLKNEFEEFEYSNARWGEITGLSADTGVGLVSYIDDEDVAAYQSAMEAASHSSRAQVVEYKFNNPSRGPRILMEYISRVYDEFGRERFIGSLLDVTELKVAQSELEKLAFYDPLTQLPNRRFFRDHLDLAMARAQKENKKIAMYMTDLDEFKKVNDSLGHDVGDTLLVDIAQRLRQVLYDGDVVSRMGGDEFMVLLDNVEDPTRLDHASSRILEALHTSVSSGNQVIQVTGSIGIAIFPTDATTPEELLRYADMALYNAKDAGGNRVSYYSHELDLRIKEKVRLEQKLRLAVENKKLEVYIQPQYNAVSHRVFWAEALVRWIDPEDGFIAPDVFVPLAEDTGLIYELGDFVIDEVFDLLVEKSDELAIIGIEGIAINLSARQFYAKNFSRSVKEKLAERGIAPKSVEFELTETIVMDDVETAVKVMEELRTLGCQFSIDDFGTGYSSLSYLKRFPITSLKIDKSFIRDIPDDQNDVEIACAVIALAQTLGLMVVAEGVETEIQASLLASYGCDFLQGYYFDRPMPIRDLLARTRLAKRNLV